MIIKLLALGDIVGLDTVEYMRLNTRKLRALTGADVIIANGENAHDVRGIGKEDVETLLDSGIDLITTGNHVWGRKDIYSVLDENKRIIRPANYPPKSPGSGASVIDVCSYRLLCINAQGTVYMDPVDNPFAALDRILEAEKGRYDLAVLDFHAEATSEKIAAGYYFDGRISAVWGTHTHVQTADETVLPGGTGYITDLGMTGPANGILGSEKEPIIEKFLTRMPQRFSVCKGEIVICGALFALDTDTKKCVSAERIRITPEMLSGGSL